MALLEKRPAARSCEGCTLCCRLPEIESLAKAADSWCRHCTGMSCAIYVDRPQLCRDFLCLWMTDQTLPDAWQPLRAHMLVYAQGPQLTILVDPNHPDIFENEPYRSDLDHWAQLAENEGRYVILFCGDMVRKIEPRSSSRTSAVNATA